MKVCGFTNAFEAFKVFKVSKQSPVVYSAAVKEPEKNFTINFIYLSTCMDVSSAFLAYSYHISEVFS